MVARAEPPPFSVLSRTMRTRSGTATSANGRTRILPDFGALNRSPRIFVSSSTGRFITALQYGVREERILGEGEDVTWRVKTAVVERREHAAANREEILLGSYSRLTGSVLVPPSPPAQHYVRRKAALRFSRMKGGGDRAQAFSALRIGVQELPRGRPLHAAFSVRHAMGPCTNVQ